MAARRATIGELIKAGLRPDMCSICAGDLTSREEVYRVLNAPGNGKNPILYHVSCGDDWAAPFFWSVTQETYKFAATETQDAR